MGDFDKWGAFDSAGVSSLPDGESHIVPCDNEGKPQPGHAWSGDCQCDPRVEICMTGNVIIVHELIP